MKILTATVVTSQQSVSSWVESKIITYMEGKLAVLRIFKQSPKCPNAETFYHAPKPLYLNEVEYIIVRAMLVLIAACDVLTSGLKIGV